MEKKKGIKKRLRDYVTCIGNILHSDLKVAVLSLLRFLYQFFNDYKYETNLSKIMNDEESLFDS
jgi:hypothetical protein